MAVQLDQLILSSLSFGSDVSSGGWTTQDEYPRVLGDVNGDGRADVVGFGGDGAYVSLGQADGTFAGASLGISAFGSSEAAGGWVSENQYPRVLSDVNSDGRADIVAFASDGVYVSLGQTDGTFSGSTLGLASFGASASAGGWTSYTEFPRQLSDVNGDGQVDIVGFAGDGVYVSLGQGNGTFAAATFGLAAFGTSAGAGGWTDQDQYPRELADANGDGRADIVAFAGDGVYVALGQANGTFATPSFALASFGSSVSAGGWTSDNQYPRELADMNGDGRADIVGFADAGVYVALSQVDGSYGAPTFALSSFGASANAGGWTSYNEYPRELADVNGDGLPDIVGFGSNGTYFSQNQGDIII